MPLVDLADPVLKETRGREANPESRVDPGSRVHQVQRVCSTRNWRNPGSQVPWDHRDRTVANLFLSFVENKRRETVIFVNHKL